MMSIFDLLEEVRRRPGMYVAGDESQGALRLRSLEQLIHGYSLALRQHGIQESVVEFARDFGEFLWETRGWSTSSGFAAAVLEAAGSDGAAWELFWRLVEEFRRARDG
ncbi:hypothetical protein [Pyxidicoccus xibeiensis]|uniref:hypothetical protein n=1 Tax=Pyxidicoccus xibeiensis TaxID=2906759 RepID=UPI0020A757EA|nr:hypothetical protein [Pyxidicoccus xibeiensis]MCP3139186.1 hypothetical protein [Pyxidicoccus xibeiensis]